MGKKRITQQTEGETSQGAKSENAPKSGRKLTQLSSARVYISASYNNTMVSVADGAGNIVVWSSAGLLGFKGPRKATPYAASKVVDNVFEKLSGVSLGRVAIYVQGVGGGRDASVRAFASRGLDIIALRDITPLPHNGCRPRKARRV